ncbi:hypothetical protein DSM104299_05848 [Baekduia alba]|uniref:hypothetical protein n=1 Tax=Baekduia alba TaxID=2997333 RepID=UPI0023401298|nr:hypothetical protein [Baekduia alba]WCB97076.1 hypothetical protein DSM104299_05848 [Baekduia alba]
MRRGLPGVLAVLALVGVLLGIATAPAVAPAQNGQTATVTSSASTLLPTAPSDPNGLSRVDSLAGTPLGHRLVGQQAQTIAARSPKVAAALKQYPKAKPEVFLKGPNDWQVSWFTPGTGSDRKEIAQVKVNDATGAIVEAWTGPQVAWTMARGYPGAFGRKVNSPWVWIPMSILFVAPFLSLRRRPQWLHLDLLVLVGFGVSVAFFNDANIHASVPVATGLLAYVLIRALLIGFRRRSRLDADGQAPSRVLPLWVSPVWLAVALVFLIGFRIGLNVNASNVIDVGYSGVIGADRLVDGKPLYDNFPKDDEHGDTYGPVAYEAYVPFEQALPWSGRWDDLPAAHAASVVFDLLTMLFLFMAGRRIRGPGLGVVLTYLWAAWPFSLYVLNCNTNDAMVAMFAALTLYVAASPAARGAVTALAGLTKFGSLGLAPLMATHGAPRGRWLKTVLEFVAMFVFVALLVSLPVLLRGESLHTIYDRTIAFQAERNAPFSIWGLHDLRGLEHVWQVLAGLFAVAAAFLPRRRDIVGLAAVATAVVVALQLGLDYWFYLYLVWFFPFLIVALFARYRIADPA